MPDIAIHALTIARNTSPDGGSWIDPKNILITGQAIVPPGYEYQWSVTVPFSASQLEISTACINAAVAVANASKNGPLIGLTDAKLLIGVQRS